jgi:hypothetical protein
MSDECWTIIVKKCNNPNDSKANMSDRVDNADKLREVVLSDLMEKQSLNNAALAYIKNEESDGKRRNLKTHKDTDNFLSR